jgi:hypothetical protein
MSQYVTFPPPKRRRGTLPGGYPARCTLRAETFYRSILYRLARLLVYVGTIFAVSLGYLAAPVYVASAKPGVRYGSFCDLVPTGIACQAETGSHTAHYQLVASDCYRLPTAGVFCQGEHYPPY